jgi:ribokinase
VGEAAECSDYHLTTSGQAGDLALGLSALGVPTSVVGNVGNDAWGKRIANDLNRAGVVISGVEISARYPTALTAAIVRRGDGERAFIGSVSHRGCPDPCGS